MLTTAYTSQTAEQLNALYGSLSAPELVALSLNVIFQGQAAVVSSFGADSAALLHMVSKADKAAPVLFLDTDRHFSETLGYRDYLAHELKLSNVISLGADAREAAQEDANGRLYETAPDACCTLRKVRPLQRGLAPFSAWFTGRRREQTFSRSRLEVFEADGARIKINPLAGWTQADVDDYFAAHNLPEHPLVAEGYPSIGCATCTSRVGAGEDARSGRWRGTAKTECGIHFAR